MKNNFTQQGFSRHSACESGKRSAPLQFFPAPLQQAGKWDGCSASGSERNHERLTSRSLRLCFRHLAVFVMLCAGLLFSATTAVGQIATTSPSSRCGEGTLVLHATALSGTIIWYDVPFYGTPLGTGPAFTTDTLLVTKTYYTDALDGAGCSLNPNSARVPVIATISVNSIQAAIFYASNTFCKSLTGLQEVTRTGTAGGTYSMLPSGLTMDPVTGAITPSTSDEGAYTITYTVVPAEGCTEDPATTVVTITDAPVTPAISYSDSVFCTTDGPIVVNQTGVTGGIYSASPSGLAINPVDGTITPASSSSGTYAVTYFVPGAGGCPPQTATATGITIVRQPTASISYASPFTMNMGSQQVTLNGTGIYTGGVYSAPAGLTIDPVSGAITPSGSTAGTYIVTYTLTATPPCTQITATTEVTIYPLPGAVISGTQSVCQNTAPPDITFTGSGGTTPYTFIYKVNNGFDQTVATTSGNSVTVSQPTITSGTYEYTLISVSDSTGSAQNISGQSATISVNIPPVALFSFPATPYCSDGVDPSPTFLDGGIAGTFSASSPDLHFMNPATGEIDLASSIAGTYTVTNTISAAGGCPEVSAGSEVTITRLPVAAFSFTGSPYCASAFIANPTVTDTGVFTADDPFVVFTNTTGTIDLVATPAGTYTINHTIIAANGCAEVSSTTDITVLAAPTMTTQRDFSICSGTSANIGLTSSPAGATYTWTIESITGSITGASAGSSPSVIDQILTNPGNSLNGTVNYSVIPTLPGGGDCAAGQPFTITITVKPTPELSSTLTPPAICSGSVFEYTPTSDAGSASFAWTRDTISGITPLGTNGTGNVSEALSNITNAPIAVTYSFITTADACSSPAQNVVVTVDPATDGGTVTGGMAICEGSTSGELSLGAHTGDIVRWESSADGNTWTPIVHTDTTYTSGALTATTHFRAVVKSGVCDEANAAATIVTVNPTITAGVTIAASTDTVCAGTSVTFTATPVNPGSSPSYQWKVNGSNSGADNPVFEYTPNAGDQVTVVMASNATPCLTGSPATSNAVIVIVNALPGSPAEGLHVPSGTEIEWKWSASAGAAGYKWNTVNNYATATDLGNVLTQTETGLDPATEYTRYVWAYSVQGCVSGATTLTETTSSGSDAVYDALSTSQAAYTAAADGDLVKITAAEYASVQSALSATAVGYTGTFNDWATASLPDNHTFSYNGLANDNTIRTFSALNYPVAFTFHPSLNPAGSYSCQVKYNNGGVLTDISNLYSGATAATIDRQYFVIKHPAQLPNATPYIALFSSGGIATVSAPNPPQWDQVPGNITGATSFTSVTGAVTQLPTLQVLLTPTKPY